MKEKIEAALKTKYSNLGFSAKAISGVAESLAATGLVTDENLAAIVEGQKSTLVAMQSEIDSRVTSAVEKAKAEAIKPPATGDAQTKQEPDIQKLIDEAIAARVNPLQEKINTYEAEKSTTARATLISNKAKELGIPEWRVAEGFVITDAMDESAIGSYLTSVKKNITTAGLESRGGFPLAGNGEATKEEVDAIVDKMVSNI